MTLSHSGLCQVLQNPTGPDSLFPCLSPSPSLLSSISGLPGSSNMRPCWAYSCPRAFTRVLPTSRTLSSLMFAWNPSSFHSWIHSNTTWSEKSFQIIFPPSAFQLFFSSQTYPPPPHPLTFYYVFIDINPDYIFVEGRDFVNHYDPRGPRTSLAHSRPSANTGSNWMLSLLIYCAFVSLFIQFLPPSL